jgi:hypothetical protein
MVGIEFTPLLAATLLAEALFVVFGIAFGLPAWHLAWRRQCLVAAIAAPVAFTIVMRVGGLLFAAPVALVVTAMYYVMFALRGRPQKWAKYLHYAFGGALILWSIAPIIHLPIRIALHQDAVRIAGNVAGIAVALALSTAFVESLVRIRRGERVAG